MRECIGKPNQVNPLVISFDLKQPGPNAGHGADFVDILPTDGGNDGLLLGIHYDNRDPVRDQPDVFVLSIEGDVGINRQPDRLDVQLRLGQSRLHSCGQWIWQPFWLRIRNQILPSSLRAEYTPNRSKSQPFATDDALPDNDNS